MIQAFTILLRAVYVFCFHVWPLKNVCVYNTIHRAEALKHDRYNIDWCGGNKRAYGALVADCLISINVCRQIIIFNAFPCDTEAVKAYTQIPFFFCCQGGGVWRFIIFLLLRPARLHVCVRTSYTHFEWRPHICWQWKFWDVVTIRLVPDGLCVNLVLHLLPSEDWRSCKLYTNFRLQFSRKNVGAYYKNQIFNRL